MTRDENAAIVTYCKFMHFFNAFFLLITYQNCKLSQGINLFCIWSGSLFSLLQFWVRIMISILKMPPKPHLKASKTRNVEEWICFVLFSQVFFSEIQYFLGIITNAFLSFIFSSFLSGYLQFFRAVLSSYSFILNDWVITFTSLEYFILLISPY